MATPPSLTQIAFAGGLDESQEDEIADPSKAFLVAKNVRQDKRGGFTKRLGYAALSRSRIFDILPSRSAGRALCEFNGAPVVIDGTYLDSFVETAAKSALIGRIAECTYRVTPVPSPTSTSVVQDAEYCNGYVALTYGSDLALSTKLAGTCELVVVNATTGAITGAPFPLGSNGVGLVGSYGGRYFIAFYYDEATGAISWNYFDTQNLSAGWTGLGTVVASSSTTAYPSICSLSGSVVIAYGVAAGGVNLARYTIAGAAATASIGGIAPGKIAIDCSNAGTLWVAYSQSTSILVEGRNPSTLASVASAVSAMTSSGIANVGVCEGSTAGTARAWVVASGSASLAMCDISTSAGAAVAGSTQTVNNVMPSSKPFLQGGRFYMAVTYGQIAQAVDGNGQALCIVVDWTADTTNNEPLIRPVANVEPGLCPAIGYFMKCSAVSSTKRMFGLQVAKRGSTTFSGITNGNLSTGCELVELDFASRNRWQSAKHGGCLYLGGALTTVFDGATVSEVGFLSRPTKPTTSLASGSLTGTYKYVAVYERVDAAGNIVVSGVSDPVSVAPSSQNVAVSTKPYPGTLRAAGAPTGYVFYTSRVVFFRTAVGGEPPYYRLASVKDTGAASISYTDSTSDATLVTRSKLYAPNLPGTAGESQDRRAPPGLVHLASFNGMLVGAKGSSLFYSGQEVYGEATWFTPAFEVPLSGSGDITGLEALDGTLFIFREDRIYAAGGDPPTDNGSVGGLGVPRLLSSDVGCIEANSIVATSLGVFFQSRRGIELLTRSGSVVWVGEAIQRTLASYPVVTSAVLDAKSSLVRFSLAASESAGVAFADGRDLVYDLVLQSWISVDDKTAEIQGQTGTGVASQDACMVNVSGTWRYAWLGYDGIVHYERLSNDASAYLDDTNWITMWAESAWFKVSGIQGQQQLNRMQILARKTTDLNLSLSLAYNYETGFRAAQTFFHGQIASLLSAGWPITQLKHDPHDDSECQSVRVRISDATPTIGTVGTGKGATWLALTFDITPKQGMFDVPEGAS